MVGKSIDVVLGDRRDPEELLYVARGPQQHEHVRGHEDALQDCDDARYDADCKYCAEVPGVLGHFGCCSADEVEQSEENRIPPAEQLGAQRQVGAEPDSGTDQIRECEDAECRNREVGPLNPNGAVRTAPRAGTQHRETHKQDDQRLFPGGDPSHDGRGQPEAAEEDGHRDDVKRKQPDEGREAPTEAPARNFNSRHERGLSRRGARRATRPEPRRRLGWRWFGAVRLRVGCAVPNGPTARRLLPTARRAPRRGSRQ